MRNYQKYGFDTIQTKNFAAFCNVYDNRSGFAHECRIEWDGVTYYAKIQYYNRTWESYEFESVILKTIGKMPKSVREQAKAEFEHYGQKLSEVAALRLLRSMPTARRLFIAILRPFYVGTRPEISADCGTGGHKQPANISNIFAA